MFLASPRPKAIQLAAALAAADAALSSSLLKKRRGKRFCNSTRAKLPREKWQSCLALDGLASFFMRLLDTDWKPISIAKKLLRLRVSLANASPAKAAPSSITALCPGAEDRSTSMTKANPRRKPFSLKKEFSKAT